jgi:hypothetical protein
LYAGNIEKLESWMEKREKVLQKKFSNEDIGLSVKIVDEEYDAHYQKDIIEML